MLEALIRAGFTIEATWPLRTNQPRGHLRYPSPPAPEVILVCRARAKNAPSATHQEFASALRRELSRALRDIQANRLAPVDLAQSSVGAGLAIYSRFASVRAPDGSRLAVHQALGNIRRALETFLFEQSAYLDRISRFAVAWFDRFGYTMHPINEARLVARKHDTTLAELTDSGVLRSRGSRTWLVRWQDLDARWRVGPESSPLVWKATHHLLRRLSLGDVREAAALLAEMTPELRREARQLAFQLYGICDRQGWVEEAQQYVALINAWGEMQAREEQQARGPVSQRRLFE
jgi:putative DNA methylase